METKQKVGCPIEWREFGVIQFVNDFVQIAILFFCLLALWLVWPNDAFADTTLTAQIDARTGSWTLVDPDTTASDRQARYAPNFERNTTARSVGTMLAQPVQPARAGISGTVPVIQLKW